MHTTFSGAPPLTTVRPYLVFFRASPTGTFPGTPFELLNPANSSASAVIADLTDGRFGEYKVNCVEALDAFVDVLFGSPFDWGAKMYTLHSNSMLSRLVRWRALKTGRQSPPVFQTNQVIDIVDAVNRPAILTGSQRYSFKVSDYVDILGLKPDTRFDTETGLLANLVLRYGNN